MFLYCNNNVLDFCLSNTLSSWGTQILYNQGGMDQKFQTGLSGYKFSIFYTDTGLSFIATM